MAAIINQTIPEFKTQAFVNGELKKSHQMTLKANGQCFLLPTWLYLCFAQLNLKTWQTITKKSKV